MFIALKQGIGIEFKEVRKDERKMLRDLVKIASAQAFIGSRTAAMKPSLANN